jgi:hypothetical protein
MNILSALCLAVAAGFTVDLVRLLTRSLVTGVAAGIAMALTPIAWAIGTHAEAHSLHLALVAVLLWLLVQWEDGVRTPAASGGPKAASRSGTTRSRSCSRSRSGSTCWRSIAISGAAAASCWHASSRSA